MDGTLRSQEKLTIIDQIPLFASLSISDKKIIAGSSLIVEYKKGDIVYREGDSPDSFYCVITGRLRAYIAKKAEEEDLEYLKRGKYFGIISILTGEPHSVNVQAVNDSIILKIPKDAFDKILKRIPGLAIHFSQTLSRRLKRKDLGEKRVFESTIVSVFGASDKIGATYYVLNLGVSIKIQTGKKVILLDMNRAGENISSFLGVKSELKPVVLDSPFFEESIVRANIFKHNLGVDIIHVLHNPNEPTHLIPLLSYLTNDYHYVIVDLPGYLDDTIFESMKQSDVVHLITACDEASLGATGKLIGELKKSSSVIGQKIKMITSEYGVSLPCYAAGKDPVPVKRDIFATLPDINKTEYKIDELKAPIVMAYPDCEYSKTIRRVSRQLGDCLIGLALGAGAAQGLAHIGVLKVIERHNIPIDILSGTSMGALIGALWASGKNADEIEKVVSRFKTKMSVLRLVDLTLPRKGLIKGREIRRFLVSQFGDKTFRDLRLPFKVITCDIKTREEIVLEEGSLVDAVMASVAIPGVFEPVKVGERFLVDGGIINPLPTNVLMKMSVAKIIAVNTLPSPEDIQRSKRKFSNIFDVIVNSVQAGEYLLAEISCQDADIALRPIVPTVDWYEFYESEKIVKKGEEESLKCLSQFRELAIAR